MKRFPVTLFLVGLAVGVVLGEQLKNDTICQRCPHNYGVVIDAGSGGSRLHVFLWGDGRPLQHGMSFTKNGSPGHVWVRHSPWPVTRNKGERMIDELLQWAQVKIPLPCHNSTPIILRGTAGLRLVTKEEAHNILTRLRTKLSKSGFAFQENWATVMTGQREATMAWIAVQHLAQVRQFALTGDLDLVNPAKFDEKVGVMDLGGGSTQIAFVATNGSWDTDTTKLMLDGKKYNIYGKSLLGYGHREALKRLFKLLKDEKIDIPQTGRKTIEFPCFVKGDVRILKLKSGGEVEMRGTGRFDHCVGLFSASFKSFPKNLHPTEISKVNGEAETNLLHFIAIGDFPELVEYFTGRKNGIYALIDVHEQMKSYCSQEGLKHKKSTQICLQSAYVYALLFHGYKFQPATTIEFVNSVRAEPMDWTAGEMLYEVLKYEKFSTNATLLGTKTGMSGETQFWQKHPHGQANDLQIVKKPSSAPPIQPIQ